MMPAKQGDLDNFCGIYSLVNAVSHLYRNRLKRKNLYLKLINQYHQKYNIIDLANYGMTNVEMDNLITEVLQQGYYYQHYPITITMPYRRISKLTTPQLFSQINQFLNKYPDNRTSVIIGTQYHWSVVRAIDGEFVYFSDSSNFNKVSRRKFSLVNQHKTYKIYFDDIYFFERAI
ncbi:hypothetical protein RHO14_03500 [Orbus wheelerorum]|uniref:hypothetical protein n=1 Tax=Orbus wheelerorum TaxID=3074111 RepID=UPI00370D21E6